MQYTSARNELYSTTEALKHPVNWAPLLSMRGMSKGYTTPLMCCCTVINQRDRTC
jgi:hypothetical protein